MQQSPSEGLTLIWEYHNAEKSGLTTAGRQILEGGALSHLLLTESTVFSGPWKNLYSIYATSMTLSLLPRPRLQLGLQTAA